MKGTWDAMTETERQWIEEAGYDKLDVESHAVDATVSRLRDEYAARGYILADEQEMERRLFNTEK